MNYIISLVIFYSLATWNLVGGSSSRLEIEEIASVQTELSLHRRSPAFSYLRTRQYQLPVNDSSDGFDTVWYLILNISDNAAIPSRWDLPAVDRHDPWRLDSMRIEWEALNSTNINSTMRQYAESRGYMYLGISRLAWLNMSSVDYSAVQNSQFYSAYLSVKLSGVPEQFSNISKIFMALPANQVPYEGVDYEMAIRRRNQSADKSAEQGLLMERYRNAGNSLVKYRSRKALRLSLIVPMLPLLLIIPLIMRYGWN